MQIEYDELGYYLLHLLIYILISITYPICTVWLCFFCNILSMYWSHLIICVVLLGAMNYQLHNHPQSIIHTPIDIYLVAKKVVGCPYDRRGYMVYGVDSISQRVMSVRSWPHGDRQNINAVDWLEKVGGQRLVVDCLWRKLCHWKRWKVYEVDDQIWGLRKVCEVQAVTVTLKLYG